MSAGPSSDVKSASLQSAIIPGRRKPVVVLLHGIRTDAKWYVNAQHILEPHFEVVCIRYPHYRHPVGGVLGLAFHPRTLLLGSTLAAGGGALAVAAAVSNHLAMAAATYGLSPWRLSVVSGVVFAGTVLLAYCGSRARLRSAVEFVKREFDDHARNPGRPPHVIAHSLGTFLVGGLLTHFRTPRFRRVILLASVLPQAFDWVAVLSRRPQGVVAVRNETGSSDWVPKAAAWLKRRFGRFAPPIGNAGTAGFIGPPDIVHTLPNDGGECSRCERSHVAPIHNAPLPYDHSGYHVGDGQCAEHWLPTLFGIAPSVYLQFLEWCGAAAEFDSAGDAFGVALMEERLLSTTWPWSGGVPLRMWFARQLHLRRYRFVPLHSDMMNRLVVRAVSIVWRGVAAGLDARPGAPCPVVDARTNLDPQRVCVAAVVRV